MTDSHTAETSLADRLFFAQVAGCTCLTKTPETKYHKPLCHFRLFVESLKRITELERENIEQARLLGMSAERELALRAEITELKRDVARYENGRVVLLAEIEARDKKITKLLQASLERDVLVDRLAELVRDSAQLKAIAEARLTWAMSCQCACDDCQWFDKLIRRHVGADATKPAATQDDLAARDLQIYGTSYVRIEADGTRTRIDPATVMIAPQPETDPPASFDANGSPVDAWPKCSACGKPIYLNHECVGVRPAHETSAAPAASSIDFHQRAGKREMCNRCDCSGEHVFPFSHVSSKCSHCSGTGWLPLSEESSR